MAGPDEQDTSRRDFFRTFGRETVRQAGAVAGAAAELRRSSMAAAQVLFDPEAATDVPEAQFDESQPDATFRSAYRFTGTDIVALDARQLPHRVATVALTDPSEVASAIRAGAINTGPVLAEVGAYAMALVARSVVARPETGRVQQVRAAANTLRAARTHVRTLTWAVERLEDLYLDLTVEGTDPAQAAQSLQSEADAIASAASAAHAGIGRTAASVILAGSDEALELLMLGDMGPLSCGLVGMGTALIQNLRDAGRDVHVWVPDGAPGGEGSRVTAFTLRQLDASFRVIPDAALGWVFDGRRIDALVLRGDAVAENGDSVVPIGGLAAASVAQAKRVPVFVLAPRTAFEPTPTGTGLGDRRAPTFDVVYSDLITRVISEAA